VKKVVLGFITGVITALTFTAFATSTGLFTAQQATFDIYVKGEKFISENPPVVIGGRTYLPLRAIGEALGVNVEWNGEARRVEIKTGEEIETLGFFHKIRGIYDTDTGYAYLSEINGFQYVSLSTFAEYLEYGDGNEIFITLPDKEPVMIRTIDNQATEHSYIDLDNKSNVRLSSLGLTAEVDGDTLIIKYK
jgi:hypothetical protein